VADVAAARRNAVTAAGGPGEIDPKDVSDVWLAADRERYDSQTPTLRKACERFASPFTPALEDALWLQSRADRDSAPAVLTALLPPVQPLPKDEIVPFLEKLSPDSAPPFSVMKEALSDFVTPTQQIVDWLHDLDHASFLAAPPCLIALAGFARSAAASSASVKEERAPSEKRVKSERSEEPNISAEDSEKVWALFSKGADAGMPTKCPGTAPEDKRNCGCFKGEDTGTKVCFTQLSEIRNKGKLGKLLGNRPSTNLHSVLSGHDVPFYKGELTAKTSKKYGFGGKGGKEKTIVIGWHYPSA